MLTVMRHLNNYFEISSERGDFLLSGGEIALNKTYGVGQYILPCYVDGGKTTGISVYRITTANSGVYTLADAPDMAFSGVVYGLRVPPDFIKICEEINTFSAKNVPSGKASEHFGPYGYTNATDATGAAITWQKAFGDKLRPYRLLSVNMTIKV